MKKFLLIGLIVSVVLILAGGAGLVYARVSNLEPNVSITLNPEQQGVLPFGYGPGGMMNGYGYGPGGMMHGYGPGGMMSRGGICRIVGVGVLRGYVITAFANAVGLTVDQVNTRIANGETLNRIAISQGKSKADLPTLASQVIKAALDKAVADAVITQAQEDRLLEFFNNNTSNGFGFMRNFCQMWDSDWGIRYR